MLGLKIRDQLRWHDRWSSEIGRLLTVRDSSNDLYIFDERHNREEIAAVLPETPGDLYDLFEVREGPEEYCDYRTDSGRCYFRS